MSVCTFFASDSPLEPYSPPRDYPLHINIDTGTIDDGGADDNFFLHPFNCAGYSDKKYAVSLEWRYTEGRAKKLVGYIKNHLENAECLEIRHVWLNDYCEFDERPIMRYYITTAQELETSDIKHFDEAEIWNNKDKNRPSFYCLTILNTQPVINAIAKLKPAECHEPVETEHFEAENAEEWRKFALKYINSAEKFEIHCWNEEKDEQKLALKYGTIKPYDWQYGVVIEGEVTEDFIALLMKTKADEGKMTPFFSVFLDNGISFEHYGRENHIVKGGGR